MKEYKRFAALILVLSILLSLMCFETIVFGANTFFSENFENYTGSLDLVEETSGNHYVKINSSESNKNIFYKDSSSYPGSDFIVSLDFMAPTGGSDRAQLLCVAWKGGNANGMHIWLDGNDIKIGNNVNPGSNASQKIATNIKRDKWYSIFAYIRNSQFSFEEIPETREECPEGPFFDVYICESTTESPDGMNKINQSFSDTWRKLYDKIGNASTEAEKEKIIGYSYLGRYIMAREYSNKDLYIDNVSVETVDYADLDIMLKITRSYAVCASVGYDNEEFPQSAVDKLMDVYDTVDNEIVTEENVEEKKAELESAIAEFKSRRIDETDTSETVNHIKVNGSGNMTTTGGVLPDSGFVATLEAEAYTKSDTRIDEADINWSVLPEDDKLSISGNTLTVEPGFEGEITLMAHSGDVYAKYKMTLVTLRNVTISDFTGQNEKIVLKGQLSGSIPSEVNVKITGDDGDELTEDIFVADSILLDENNEFSIEQAVDENTPYQKLTAIIEGGGIATKETSTYYYGEGWENGVLTELNTAEPSEIASVLRKHSSVLFVDTALLDLHTEVYVGRVKKETYASLKAVDDAVIQTEYVLKQSTVTRNGIEELLGNNKFLLNNNGFDIEKIGNLGETLIPMFYTNAATIEVDTLNDSVKDICDKLNAVYESLSDVEEDSNDGGSASNPSNGGSGGSGGSGGGGKYPVSLVGGKNDTEKSENATEKAPFGDVKKDDWSYEAFKFLKEKGIMVGDGVNVRPTDNVTRGEFAKIIVTAFDFKGSGKDAFTDGNGMWWNEYASIAAECGIVNGMGNGTFGGNGIINREMLAVMIARAIKAKNINLYDQNDGLIFNDEAYMSDYAKESIEYLAKKGIVTGIGENLYNPSSLVTRAEAAQIVYNVLKQL